jgi:pimeloyl-ACP methyl ester carboxylesterase
MNIILIAGLWLPHTMWHDVTAELHRLGHRPLALALPGVDDRLTSATLDDQLAAALAAVDDAADRVVVVGHSAASTLAWLVADRRPDRVRSVVMIGGFPSSNGSRYADFFPIADGVMAFPGWEPFEGPDAADLDDNARARLARDAVPVPEAVAHGTVTFGDERRYDVPVVLVCPEYNPEQARTWIENGDVPELARTRNVSVVDIDSGHWPMVTRPVELAALIDAASRAEGLRS